MISHFCYWISWVFLHLRFAEIKYLLLHSQGMFLSPREEEEFKHIEGLYLKMKCWSQYSAPSQFRIHGNSENFKHIINKHGSNTENGSRKLKKLEVPFHVFLFWGKWEDIYLDILAKEKFQRPN